MRTGKSSPPLSHRDIRTILGEGTHFNGVLSFEGAVRIDGELEGEIISNGTLIVGEKAVIQADIKVNSLTVGGKVYGKIIVADRMEILAHAEICGNIQTPILKVEEGAIFQGSCDMRRDNQEPMSISYVKEEEPLVVTEHPVEMKKVPQGETDGVGVIEK